MAAKQKLDQLAEEARELEKRKAARDYWEKTQEEERAQEAASMVYHQNQAKYLAQKEKKRLEEKAKEDERNLRRHNKTVKQVLNQVAKASRQGKDADNDGDDEETEEESSTGESENVNQQTHQDQHALPDEGREGPTGEGQEVANNKAVEPLTSGERSMVSLSPSKKNSLSLRKGSQVRRGSQERRESGQPSAPWQPSAPRTQQYVA